MTFERIRHRLQHGRPLIVDSDTGASFRARGVELDTPGALGQLLRERSSEVLDHYRTEVRSRVDVLSALTADTTPRALAEVPLAATVGGRVIAGTADRLLVTKDSVLLVDFKTAARPPLSLEAVPITTLRQMAAYVAALEAIYPDKRVEAAVLYTRTPQLFALPASLVEQHKSALSPAQ